MRQYAIRSGAFSDEAIRVSSWWSRCTPVHKQVPISHNPARISPDAQPADLGPECSKARNGEAVADLVLGHEKECAPGLLDGAEKKATKPERQK